MSSKEILFSPEETREARLEFINAERSEVAQDLKLVFGILVGIQSTLMMMFLVRNSPVSSATNRLVYLMFLFSPWIVIYLIWQWNQDYYFDALGIRIILVEIVFIEFISMGMLVFELVGTGTNLPHVINDTVTILFYSLIVIILLGLNIFFVYLLLQTEERPRIPLVRAEKFSQSSKNDLPLSENISAS